MQRSSSFDMLCVSMRSLLKKLETHKKAPLRSMIGMFFIFAFSLVLLAMLWRQAVNLEVARRMERQRVHPEMKVEVKL